MSITLSITTTALADVLGLKALIGDSLKISGNGLVCGDLTVRGTIHGAFDGNMANAINTLTSPDGSIIITPDDNHSIALEANPLFGNVLRVDAVFGSDCSGSRNELPFATINAAMEAASSDDVILIFPGTYAESFTIKDGVSIVGLSSGASRKGGVRIMLTDVTTDTDLITMGEDSRLENVTLSLSSTADVHLRGIVFPGTTSSTASVSEVRLHISNMGTETGSIYGIHSIGYGTPDEATIALERSAITISSKGIKATRGILIDTNPNTFNVNDSTIMITNPDGGSAIGIETNCAGAACTVSNATISGITADISQTMENSSITLVNTRLTHANTNGFNFTSTTLCGVLNWATLGSPGTGNSFMVPGTGATVSAINTLPYILPQALIIKNLTVHANTPPGSGTTTFTIFKNGIATSLITTLTDSQTANANTNMSVPCNAGDRICLQIANPTGTPSNIAVTTELY